MEDKRDPGIVIDQNQNGIFRIGVTDGIQDRFYFYADTLKAAEEAAACLKMYIESILFELKGADNHGSDSLH